MITFNHARETLATEMARLQDNGQGSAVCSIDISAVESGDGAVLSAMLANGHILAAYFDLESWIDPTKFDREPYLAQLFSASRTVH
jgi:hypothetical protein